MFNIRLAHIALRRFFKAFILSFIPVYVSFLQQGESLFDTGLNTAITAGVIGGLMAIEKYVKESTKK